MNSGHSNLCPAIAFDLEGVDSTYTTDCALVLDVGGDDRYHNNAGGSNLGGGFCGTLFDPEHRGVAALVDLGSGQDEHGNPANPRDCGANGGGFGTFGVGFLLDAGGNDLYTAGSRGTNGGGCFGAGFLLDVGGNDTYSGGTCTNGGGAGFGTPGVGFLLDAGGNDTYSAGDGGATNGGGNLGVGFLFDAGGNDLYTAGDRGTNGGGYAGVGFLLDGGGNDTYTAGTDGTNGGGGTFVVVPGVGFLLDAGGKDRYQDPEVPGGACWDCTVVPKGLAGAHIDELSVRPDRVLNTGNYASTDTAAANFWRGYTFTVSQPIRVTHLRGGHSGSRADMWHVALYAAPDLDMRGQSALTPVASTPIPPGRFTEVPITPVILTPGQPYLIAQGRETGGGGHHRLTQIDTTSLVAQEPHITGWGPSDGNSFSFSSGDPTTPLTVAASSSTTRPHIGFGYIEPPVPIPPAPTPTPPPVPSADADAGCDPLTPSPGDTVTCRARVEIDGDPVVDQEHDETVPTPPPLPTPPPTPTPPIDPDDVLPPPGHPSDDCTGGSVVVDGYLGELYLKLRITPDAGSDDTWVCVAADDGTSSLGGRLAVDGDPDVPPVVRQDEPEAPISDSCAQDPDNQRVQSGVILEEDYWIDVTPGPEDESAALWVCVRLTDAVGFRLEVPSSTGAAGFLPDSLAPRSPRPAEAPWPVQGEPSADCAEAATGTPTRLVNADVGGSQVALYTWQESADRAHLCLRGPDTGGRITVDGSASPGVSPVLTTSTTDLSPCTFRIFSVDQPPTLVLWTHEDPREPAFADPPASACLTVAGFGVRASVADDEAATVEWHEDTT